MATLETNLGSPMWTTKAEKRGLDPLGMQTTSVALYQQLVPGISNVTLRMRYYGFYAWLAHRYAKDVRDTSVETWCLYLRRAEALYALVAINSGGERGVVGVDWAIGALASAESELSFHSATDRGPGERQYLKQKFGAFGAAYGSQLVTIGVLEPVPGHDVPVPTKAMGEKLAAAFADAIGGCAEVFLNAAQTGVVSRNVLSQLVAMLPSRISPDSVECALYQSLLLEGHGIHAPQAASRSQSLRLVLKMTREHGSSLRMDSLRWAFYAAYCGTAIDEPEEDTQLFSWAVYQANDLLHVCYETILKLALDILDKTPTGVPFEKLVAQTVEYLLAALDAYPVASWVELTDALDLVANPWTYKKAVPLSEFTLHQAALKCAKPEVFTTPESACSAVLLLGVLYKRFGGVLERIAQELRVLAQGDFLRSLVTEVRFLEAHSAEPLQTLLTRLVQQRVLDRHLWVAIQKFRGQGDYTFLLESDDGRVRLRQKDGPVLTNPRLGSAVAFLEDIHLLTASGPTLAGLAAIEAA